MLLLMKLIYTGKSYYYQLLNSRVEAIIYTYMVWVVFSDCGNLTALLKLLHIIFGEVLNVHASNLVKSFPLQEKSLFSDSIILDLSYQHTRYQNKHQ